jgi:hypothetical protein
MQNIGAKPYTDWLLSRRSSKLVAKFPKYHPTVVESFSKGEKF